MPETSQVDTTSTQEIDVPFATITSPTGPIWTVLPPLEAPADDDELLPGGFAAEPEPDAKPASKPKQPRPRPGAGDLTLLRRHSDIRARCLAGVLVPFVVYFAVQLAIGSSGRQMLLFIFIPLILAGVLLGKFLDAGHKRYPAPQPPAKFQTRD